MTENSELVVYGAFALYVAKEFLAPLVKSSFARNVQAADERAKKVDAKIEEHDRELNALKLEKISSTQLSSSLGEIKGQLTSNYQSLDTRIAEQGRRHDEKLQQALSQLSHDFNQKLVSTLNVELERTVRKVVLEEQRLPRRRSGA